MAGLFDTLFEGIAGAIADIRQRVVEEGWFGRIVTDDPVEMTNQPRYRDIEPEGRGFEDMWLPETTPARTAEIDHEPLGIDR